MVEANWRPATLTLTLLAAAAALAGTSAAQGLAPSRWIAAALHPDMSDMAEVVFAYATLPRAVAALTSGAALGLGAALFQLALRNPLAVPDTLGVVGGAQLALAAATLWAPAALVHLGRGPVAFAGGCAAVGIAVGAAWHGGLRPALLLPAGLATSFYVSAMATLLLLLDAHDLAGLSAWSGGSLAVQDWDPVLLTTLVVLASTSPVVVLRRALASLDLDDATARALGVPAASYRLAALGLGVTLTAAVTGEFGPFGFVGIGAALLAQAAGARRPGARLLWAVGIGAGLLWLADAAANLAGPLIGGALATGSVTALVGVPLLLAATSRVHLPMMAAGGVSSRSWPRPPRTVFVPLAAAFAASLTVGFVVGHGTTGWEIDLGAPLARVLPWRAPRTLAAAAAGALLAVSGTLLQRVTSNPMASPDMLGLGAGAGLGLLLAMSLGLGPAGAATLATAGAGATGLAVLAWALRGGFAPARLLVVGLSLGSCAEALIGAFAATGDPRATTILAWAAGSTARATPGSAVAAWAALATLAPVVLLLGRPLDLIALGPVQARALGLAVGPAGLAACLAAALAAGVGTLVAGPFSFVGLIAPQVAARLGLARALPQVAGAAVIGATIMSLGDAVGRMVDFPWQVPAGLMSALIGAPLMLVLFGGRRG